jgi:hypothetical protein
MTRWKHILAVPVVVLHLGACAPAAAPAPAAPAPAGPAAAPPATAAVRAVTGDQVRMLLMHVRADRRQQFDELLNQTLIPLFDQAAALDPQVGRQRRQTRVLQPAQANADGTYTYAFLLDPPVPGASYDFRELFPLLGIPQAQAAEYIRAFQESLARPQETRTYIVR